MYMCTVHTTACTRWGLCSSPIPTLITLHFLFSLYFLNVKGNCIAGPFWRLSAWVRHARQGSAGADSPRPPPRAARD